MAGSYQLIDYSLRPAKHAERKMLSEIFGRLKAFGSLESYRYIGFGSIWFADCALFHKSLGIQDIISIEREVDHKARFEFNNPFKGIHLEMRPAADVFPALDWSHRTILWSDYDDPLSPSILDDVRTVASRAQSGSAFAVSVQAHKLFERHEDGSQTEIVAVGDFQRYFGAARTPTGLSPSDLRGWTLSRTSRKAILDEIHNALDKVNGGRSAGQRISFKLITSFEYADGAKMTTIVGVFVDQGQNGMFESCGFRDLSYYRDDNTAFRIEMPMLTPREMRYLDRSLPCNGAGEMELGPVPERDAKNYAKLYRYLPNFASLEH